jgi:hypothetical protein
MTAMPSSKMRSIGFGLPASGANKPLHGAFMQAFGLS